MSLSFERHPEGFVFAATASNQRCQPATSSRFSLGGLPGGLCEVLPTIFDPRVRAQLLQERLDPLLAKALHEPLTLSDLALLPLGAIGVDAVVHAEHHEAILRTNGVTDRADWQREGCTHRLVQPAHPRYEAAARERVARGHLQV